MKTLKLLAPAKLNLNLHVFPQKLSCGYFPVQHVNCQVELADEILFMETRQGIEIECDNVDIPKGNKNLVYQAAMSLFPFLNEKKGVKIILNKRIPIKAGLAGGSSDAAITLLGLNSLWDLQLTQNQLMTLAVKIGMDVPLLVVGGLVFVSGVGEKVEKLPFFMPKLSVIIVTPEVTKPSTAWSYKHLDLAKIGKNENKAKQLLGAIGEKNLLAICHNLHNDFEFSMVELYPVVGEIKKLMIKEGSLGVLMAGAGLSVFGFYQNDDIAKKAFFRLKQKFPKVFLTRTLP
jgi:4-diphosphocytidyl-2-C-methyl-D-erythritol kinase